MIAVMGVPSAGVTDLWPRVAPLVERAVAEGPRDYETDDYLAACTAADMQLWLIFADADLVGAAITALQAELEPHLENDEDSNRKNGSTPKTVKSAAGSFELNTPRDRAGTFEPQIVKKHQTHLTDELERKIIGLFALGTSYQDIRSHIEEIDKVGVIAQLSIQTYRVCLYRCNRVQGGCSRHQQ